MENGGQLHTPAVLPPGKLCPGHIQYEFLCTVGRSVKKRKIFDTEGNPADPSVAWPIARPVFLLTETHKFTPRLWLQH